MTEWEAEYERVTQGTIQESILLADGAPGICEHAEVRTETNLLVANKESSNSDPMGA